MAQIDTHPQDNESLNADWFGLAEKIAEAFNQGTKLNHRNLEEIARNHLGDNSWAWRQAYDAAEIATRVFLRQWLPAMTANAENLNEMTQMLHQLQALLPTQRWRNEEQNALQQFSTPIGLAGLAVHAACITKGMSVLEPSAGTGALAIFAEYSGAKLTLNEVGSHRVQLLEAAFPDSDVTNCHAAYIHAHHNERPMVDAVLMNPPFSADPNKGASRSSSETVKHFQAAFYRLKDAGRAVIITGHTMTARRLVAGLEVAAPRLSVVTTGRLFAPQGTSMDIALHIIDKQPDDGGHKIIEADSFDSLVKAVENQIPKPSAEIITDLFADTKTSSDEIALLEYHPNPISVTSTAAGIFQPWQAGAVQIPNAKPHPSQLAEAVAMAAIRAPAPSHQPLLPKRLIEEGILSDAQLETVIHAGDAHNVILPQTFAFDEDKGAECISKSEDGFRLRQGFFLGDGTGAGKGRQVAAIILDNWHHGRTKALWVSISDKLVEDAKRDWLAVGGSASDIIPLSKYKQGAEIAHEKGILFTTYATLRSGARNGKIARIDQITNWLGEDFGGCIAFDEAHAMGNAAGGEKSLRGAQAPSKQGLAGLALQNKLPLARVCYVSATGAASVNALAYATRLGLWSQPTIPFINRSEFVTAMEQGGVAAAEIVARDLKALGLYTARSLSYDGVEIDVLNAPLNDEQTAIYDEWAAAFLVIHNNLEKALESTGVVGIEGGTRNKNAKSAARSAFESTKQRFFNNLLTGIKCAALFKSIDGDLAAGNAVVIQIVSTGEAVMERCLDRIHPSQWNDLHVDVTPKDAVLDYLMGAFPTQMQVEYTDEDGNLRAEPMTDDNGNPVHDPLALAARDKLVERLVSLPPMPTALDQINWYYGHDAVAEITGRSRRIVKRDGRMMVERRSASSSLTEAAAFMGGEKQILIFSQAGGTGRSYHADINAGNQNRRIHYLLEPGWRADNAIQGLGRSNRTGQVVPPVFRPVSTDVKGEKRFIATIARRLDTLGAITRGQRSSANQGMFKEEDNLESPYARAALVHFYKDLVAGRIDAVSKTDFEAMTGLAITYEGGLKDTLPPMHTFLNRLLALPIANQNAIFEELESRMISRIEIAKQNGTYELGMETIKAEHIRITASEDIPNESNLRLYTIEMQHKITPKTLGELRVIAASDPNAKWCKNEYRSRYSKGAMPSYALVVKTASLFNENGKVISRVEMIRPDHTERMQVSEFLETKWTPISIEEFTAGWAAEVAKLPPFLTKELNMVTGTLLPVWTRLPNDAPKVRRLTTDDGEVLLGRVLHSKQLQNFRKAMGLEVEQDTADQLWRRLMDERGSATLAGDLSLSCVRSNGQWRIRVIDSDNRKKDWLKDQGCHVELDQYQLFITAPNEACLAKIIKTYPVIG